MFFVLGGEINSLFAQDYQKFEKIRLKDLQFELPIQKINKPKQIEKLSPSLDNLYKPHLEGKEYKQFATQSNLQLVDDRVVVTVLPQFGSTIAHIDEDILRALGARVKAKAKHSMRVEMPISQLEDVDTKVKEIGLITEPIKPVEFAITSEGVTLMNADNWQAFSYGGFGVKVAVIDGGFQSLTEAQVSGEKPSSYRSYDFTGEGLETGTSHGTAVAEAVFDVAHQAEFYLYNQNYLNPFNSGTRIRYTLPVRARVVLKVYNTLGEEVAVLVDGEKEAGEYTVQWDAKGLPGGVYLYRLQADGYVETKNMLLLR